jgi:hypothetical protein
MKKAEARGTVKPGQWMPIAALGVLLVCSLHLSGCTSEAVADQTTARADLVDIADRAGFEELERPAVIFAHDLHTEVMLDREEDCDLCHPTHPDGVLSVSYERLEEVGEDELIELYHDNCIGCHQESLDAGEDGGPVACGDCHLRQSPYVSSMQLFAMDKSLHYRHIEAAQDECGACHHVYDEEKEELVYVEGEESSCRDCHREETEENRSAYKLVAHEACIGCHREPPAEIIVEGDDAGPQFCYACHDLEAQLAIERIENPPRLDRGQEDFLLLTVAEADLEASQLRTVPFSHVDHEAAADSCRICHHQTLESCSECHTLQGTEESEGVNLFRAMHAKRTDHSCVGCHDTEKTTPECAGCHDQMEQARLPEQGCELCHQGPLPELLESERSRYRSLDDFRPAPSEVALSFTLDDIPETLEIGSLSDEFEPAIMPHRQMVEKLIEHISESSTATFFHGHEDVVCQGCHHQSPLGEDPPLCVSCHVAGSADLELMKPALKGAYHQQCLGCHESMGLEEPDECSDCHAEKKQSIQTASSSGAR